MHACHFTNYAYLSSEGILVTFKIVRGTWSKATPLGMSCRNGIVRGGINPGLQPLRATVPFQLHNKAQPHFRDAGKQLQSYSWLVQTYVLFSLFRYNQGHNARRISIWCRNCLCLKLKKERHAFNFRSPNPNFTSKMWPKLFFPLPGAKWGDVCMSVKFCMLMLWSHRKKNYRVVVCDSTLLEILIMVVEKVMALISLQVYVHHTDLTQNYTRPDPPTDTPNTWNAN